MDLSINAIYVNHITSRGYGDDIENDGDLVKRLYLNRLEICHFSCLLAWNFRFAQTIPGDNYCFKLAWIRK